MVVDGDSTTALVLDSWPVLEWLKGRAPVTARFDNLMDEVQAGRFEFHMSRMNRGEVLYSIPKANEIQDRVRATSAFLSIPLRTHSVDDRLVDEAVALKARYSFSFADAFAAALAMRLKSPVVTGDKEFKQLEAEGLIQLHWLGA